MGVKTIAVNKKARYDYFVMDTYEAGLVLMGSEVKSLRNGQCQLKDSFVDIQKNEAYLLGVHISEYANSNMNNHPPERKRKLLMHREEIDKIDAAIREKGLTVVPLKVYFKRGRIKVEIATVKGKKKHDKRESIKTRDVNRELAQNLRRDR